MAKTYTDEQLNEVTHQVMSVLQGEFIGIELDPYKVNDSIEALLQAQGFTSKETVCILTGAAGENADDCTTHDHEGTI